MSMDNCTECSDLENLEDGLCLPCRESGINHGWGSECKDKLTDFSKGKLTYTASEYPQLYIFGEQTIERHDPEEELKITNLDDFVSKPGSPAMVTPTTAKSNFLVGRYVDEKGG